MKAFEELRVKGVLGLGEGGWQDHRSGSQAKRLDIVLQEVKSFVLGTCPDEHDF